MRLLFKLDGRDYDQCTHTKVRNSSRAIILQGHKIAMVHSLKYDYYKFPGGGIENGETPDAALIRETREETGLIVIPESIKEFGYVRRIQKSEDDDTECFVQDNYYYLCEVEEEKKTQLLDKYERLEDFTLEFVLPEIAITTNRNTIKRMKSSFDQMTIEREARVLELLKETICQKKN